MRTLVLAAALGLAGCNAILGIDDYRLGADADPTAIDASVDAEPVCQPVALGGVTFERIATWRDDAVAAYSLIHAGGCDPRDGVHSLALAALERRGLRAAIAPTVAACDSNQQWSALAAAAMRGHEIASAGQTGAAITAGNAASEIVAARTAFAAHLPAPVELLVPSGDAPAAVVTAARDAGFLGALAGSTRRWSEIDLPINPPGADAEHSLAFGQWPHGRGARRRLTIAGVLAAHAHDAIASRGWAVQSLFGVTDGDPALAGHGPAPTALAVYEAHLDLLVAARRSNQLWIAPPSTVLRYRRAAAACRASAAGDRITFDSGDPACRSYATPISVIVRTGDAVAGLRAEQAGARVDVLQLGPSLFSVTADPTGGEVTLTGCDSPGRAVVDEPLPAPPTAVTSVCDIERGAGTGDAGRMDDFERPAAELRLMPNPSQQDGRSGSWDVSPPQAILEQVTDGGSRALRFRATGLRVFAGATLAFRGAQSGSGTCYDASRYTGIRFRIRGNVAGDSRVYLSVVTAETQNQRYGGDHVGEGGHFYAVVPVTSTWEPITVPFADLQRPSWGTTTGLTRLAKTKLQAVDWGVSNTATSFDVYLDHIELY